LRNARQKLKVEEISIGHLAKVAETQYWTDEAKSPIN
jgi:hypothetical protein